MKPYGLKISQENKKLNKSNISIHQLSNIKDLNTNEFAFQLGKSIAYSISAKGLLYKKGFNHFTCVNFEILYDKISTKFTLKKTTSVQKRLLKTSDGWFTIIDNQTEKPLAIALDMFDSYDPEIFFADKSISEFPRRKSPEILTPNNGAVKRKSGR